MLSVPSGSERLRRTRLPAGHRRRRSSTEHPERHGPQAEPVLFEPLGRPLLVVHVTFPRLGGSSVVTEFLESDDLFKEFEVLRSRGVTFVQPEPERYPFGARLTALDPDGNRIELRQRSRGRSSDN
jgi:Glyoxalase/Bleomycin resistance protein/Dioxygenase superfamily